MTWVTRGDGTKGKGGGEKILAHGTDRTNHQLKVVQEFLADLEILPLFCKVILWPPEQMSVMALVDKSDELDIRYPTWCSTPSKIQFRL